MEGAPSREEGGRRKGEYRRRGNDIDVICGAASCRRKGAMGRRAQEATVRALLIRELGGVGRDSVLIMIVIVEAIMGFSSVEFDGETEET